MNYLSLKLKPKASTANSSSNNNNESEFKVPKAPGPQPKVKRTPEQLIRFQKIEQRALMTRRSRGLKCPFCEFYSEKKHHKWMHIKAHHHSQFRFIFPENPEKRVYTCPKYWNNKCRFKGHKEEVLAHAEHIHKMVTDKKKDQKQPEQPQSVTFFFVTPKDLKQEQQPQGNAFVFVTPEDQEQEPQQQQQQPQPQSNTVGTPEEKDQEQEP